MFHPYVLLGCLVFALGLFGSGVSIGYKWSERRVAADVLTAQVAAIERANSDAEIEKQRALSAAKAEADARAKARAVRHRGELDAALKARPECARDVDSLGMLNDAINAANDQAGSAGKLPDAVRTDLKTTDWLGTGRAKLGIPNN